MSITWRAAVAGLEAAMALCAALNLAYFLHRTLSVEPWSRKLAALVLTVLFLGSLAESVVLIAWLWADENQRFAAAAWVLARSLTFAGTGCISALVLRAMGDGR